MLVSSWTKVPPSTSFAFCMCFFEICIINLTMEFYFSARSAERNRKLGFWSVKLPKNLKPKTVKYCQHYHLERIVSVHKVLNSLVCSTNTPGAYTAGWKPALEYKKIWSNCFWLANNWDMLDYVQPKKKKCMAYA